MLEISASKYLTFMNRGPAFDFEGEDETNEDVFICRKCNKYFKSLPDYLDHKIKDENFRIAQTRSKADKRFSLPKLVQRKKQIRVKNPKNDGRGNAVPDSNDGSDGNNLPTNNSEINRPAFRDNLPTAKTEINHAKCEDGVITYECSQCKKSFRREASLRCHMKYEHKQKDGSSDESDAEDGSTSDWKEKDTETNWTPDDNDEDFKVEEETEKGDDHHLSEDNKESQQQLSEAYVIGKKTGSIPKEKSKKLLYLAQSDSERPYACKICSRAFKELSVLKAHAVVHTNDRKFVCTVEGCPYGFKTKGCLVRHMRRHTGERPFECERCGRAFAESGALTRHLKARRNCKETPDTLYPRYKKKWDFHPNIPAVLDPAKRDASQGPSTLGQPEGNAPLNKLSFIISCENQEVDDQKYASNKEYIVTEEFLHKTAAESEDLINEDETCDTPSKPSQPQVQTETQTVKLEVGPEESQVNIGTEPDSEILELQSIAEAELLKPTQCQVCKKDFPAEEGLELHLHSHLVDKPSHCGLCHFVSTNREELRQHILAMHYESLNDIEASILASEDLTPGSEKSSSDKRATLREALMAVKQLYNIKKTRGSPTEPAQHEPSTAGVFKCMVCDKRFRGGTYLRQHMRMHTGDRPYQCTHPGCNQSFTSRDVLKKHMFVHSEQRNYKCGECGKMFKRMAHVQQHLRVHFQERSFRCSICTKLFKSMNSLKVHLRTHSGINPYRCNVCGRHFRERGSLQRHQRLHTGEKPYVCHKCNRGFAEQGTLSRHLKAKVPCTGPHEQQDIAQPRGPDEGTVLAQFSSVVADTQQYILPQLDDLMVPVVQHSGQEEQNREYVVGNIEVIAASNRGATVPDGSTPGETLLIATDFGQDVDGPVNEELVEDDASLMEGQMVIDEQMIDVQTMESQIIDNPVVEAIANVEGEQTETLQIFDASTGESVIIVADSSIVDLVREQQLTFDSAQGESSLEKIKELIVAAGQGHIVTSTQSEGEVSNEGNLTDPSKVEVNIGTSHIKTAHVEYSSSLKDR